MLGRDVNADLRKTDVPGNAGIVYDRAATVLEHDRDFVTHRIENAPDVGVEHAPILRFGRLIERCFPFDAGVVKGDVEPAEFVDGEIDHLFHVAIFGNVCADECRVAAKLLDFCHDLRAFFFATTSQHDFRPGASKRERRCLADTGSSSGHQRNFP